MDYMIKHREKIHINTNEEIEKICNEKRMMNNKETLKRNLKEIESLINICAEGGNKFAIHRHFGDTYDGMLEDIISILESKGYIATKHKVFMGDEILAIIIGLPFSESEEKIKDYVKRESRNSIEGSLLMLFIMLVLFVGLLFIKN